MEKFHYQKDLLWINLAIEEAKKAYAIKEVPVGALVVEDHTQTIFASAYNLKETTNNPCAHAEVLAIEKAAKLRGDWRLTGCTLYVSLEPCLLCLGAMTQARVDRLVFGAYDLKGGALSLGYWFHQDLNLNHRFSICGGVSATPSSQLLKSFFQQLRSTQ